MEFPLCCCVGGGIERRRRRGTHCSIFRTHPHHIFPRSLSIFFPSSSSLHCAYESVHHTWLLKPKQNAAFNRVTPPPKKNNWQSANILKCTRNFSTRMKRNRFKDSTTPKNQYYIWYSCSRLPSVPLLRFPSHLFGR